MTRDFIGILEAAYTDTPSAAAWRARVLEAGTMLDRGLGVVFARSDLTGARHRHCEVEATTPEPLRRTTTWSSW